MDKLIQDLKYIYAECFTNNKLDLKKFNKKLANYLEDNKNYYLKDVETALRTIDPGLGLTASDEIL